MLTIILLDNNSTSEEKIFKGPSTSSAITEVSREAEAKGYVHLSQCYTGRLGLGLCLRANIRSTSFICIELPATHNLSILCPATTNTISLV